MSIWKPVFGVLLIIIDVGLCCTDKNGLNIYTTQTLNELRDELIFNDTFRNEYYNELTNNIKQSQWEITKTFISKPDNDTTNNQVNNVITMLEESNNNITMYPLAFIPVVIKDNLNTIDYNTTAGTPGMKDFRPSVDATLVKKIRDAGGIIFGKANMHELARGTSTDNAFFGRCLNACDFFDPETNEFVLTNETTLDPDVLLSPGGSSGGTATAVAAGFAPIGLCSDTGCSCRLPGAYQGVIGYRPTINRYFTDGTVPLSNLRDVVGIIAQKMDDLITLDNVLSDADDDDIIVPETFRVVALYDWFLNEDTNPIVSESFNLTLKYLDTLDNIEVIYDFDTEIERVLQSAPTDYDFPRDFRQFIEVYNVPKSYYEIINESLISFDSIENAYPVSPKVYHTYLNQRTSAVAWWTKYLKDNNYDAFVYPASKFETPKVGTTNGGCAQNMGLTPSLGFPSISVPGYKILDSGFDVGFEIAGLYDYDKIIFQIAKLVENVRNIAGYQQFIYDPNDF